MKKEKRTFDTGATRDIDDGKLEYSRYINPLADYSFAKYMLWKQIIWWEYRRGDNWQKWIPEESLFDSLIRHTEIVKLLRKWYDVIETKKDWLVELHVSKDTEMIDTSKYDFVDVKTMEQELNAIRFNTEAMKLYYI